MKTRYFDRRKNRVESELVYGERAVHWLYDTLPGKLLGGALVARATASGCYGMLQNSSWSRRKIAPFVEKFGIDLSEFESREYKSFNDFFIRKFKSGSRTFCREKEVLPAFCEGRYYGHERVSDSLTIPVKGQHLRPEKLLASNKWGKVFRGGPLLLARLCPIDYHRFHFPDAGQVLDHYRLPGLLHSVNPLALTKKGDIFFTNKREVSILDTDAFGKLAYIEVGAVCVGRIVQTYHGKEFFRGQEKGYFMFGGSSVILMGVPGAWIPAEDILAKTKEGMETLVRLGEPLGEAYPLLDPKG